MIVWYHFLNRVAEVPAVMNMTLLIPHSEVRDFATLMDSVKKRVIETELGLDHKIYLLGPINGISITVRYPEFDEDKPKDVFIVDVRYDPLFPRDA